MAMDITFAMTNSPELAKALVLIDLSAQRMHSELNGMNVSEQASELASQLMDSLEVLEASTIKVYSALLTRERSSIAGVSKCVPMTPQETIDENQLMIHLGVYVSALAKATAWLHHYVAGRPGYRHVTASFARMINVPYAAEVASGNVADREFERITKRCARRARIARAAEPVLVYSTRGMVNRADAPNTDAL